MPADWGPPLRGPQLRRSLLGRRDPVGDSISSLESKVRGGTRACAGGSDDSPASRAEWTTAHATPNVTAAGAGCARRITVPRKLTDGMRLGTYEPSGVCVGSRAASVKYLGPHSKLALAERHALAAHEAPTSGKLSV